MYVTFPVSHLFIFLIYDYLPLYICTYTWDDYMHILITALDDGIKHSYLAWQGDIGYTVYRLHFLDTSNVSLLHKWKIDSRFSPSSGPVNPVEDFVLVDCLEQFGFDTETICQSLMGMPPFGGYDDRSAAKGAVTGRCHAFCIHGTAQRFFIGGSRIRIVCIYNCMYIYIDVFHITYYRYRLI